MKEFQVEIKKRPKINPLNIEYSKIDNLTRMGFLKLKNDIKKDKKHNYSLKILSGQEEPISFWEGTKERVIRVFNKPKRSIKEMQDRNTFYEYIQHKYVFFFLIISSIIVTLITVFITKLFDNP